MKLAETYFAGLIACKRFKNTCSVNTYCLFSVLLLRFFLPNEDNNTTLHSYANNWTGVPKSRHFFCEMYRSMWKLPIARGTMGQIFVASMVARSGIGFTYFGTFVVTTHKVSTVRDLPGNLRHLLLPKGSPYRYKWAGEEVTLRMHAWHGNHLKFFFMDVVCRRKLLRKKRLLWTHYFLGTNHSPLYNKLAI